MDAREMQFYYDNILLRSLKSVYMSMNCLSQDDFKCIGRVVIVLQSRAREDSRKICSNVKSFLHKFHILYNRVTEYLASYWDDNKKVKPIEDFKAIKEIKRQLDNIKKSLIEEQKILTEEIFVCYDSIEDGCIIGLACLYISRSVSIRTQLEDDRSEWKDQVAALLKKAQEKKMKEDQSDKEKDPSEEEEVEYSIM